MIKTEKIDQTIRSLRKAMEKDKMGTPSVEDLQLFLKIMTARVMIGIVNKCGKKAEKEDEITELIDVIIDGLLKNLECETGDAGDGFVQMETIETLAEAMILRVEDETDRLYKGKRRSPLMVLPLAFKIMGRKINATNF